MDGLRGCGGARCDGARVQADAGGRVQILQWMPAPRSVRAAPFWAWDTGMGAECVTPVLKGRRG